MKPLLSLACALLLLAATAASAAEKTAAPDVPPAVLKIANRTIITVRTSLGPSTPAERVAAVERRIESLPPSALREPLSLHEVNIDGQPGRVVQLGARWLFAVMQGDLDPEARQTLDEATEETKSRVAEALAAKADQRELPVLLKGIGYSIGATLLFALIAVPLVKLRRRASVRLESAAARRLERLAAHGVDAAPHVVTAIRWALNVAAWGVLLVSAHAWLTFVLSQFPLTAPWGQALGNWLLGMVEDLGLGLISAIPGLATVIVIFLLARWLSQILRGVFEKATAGLVSIPGVYPETAGATRRIAVALVWLFAFAAAYPYLPGANTDAFKGISVFVGLMISLGSSGLVGQAMSGLVLVYSRSMVVGDFVRSGDTEGVVSEMGMLSTKVVTMRGEEVTLPNNVLLSGAIKNHSRLNRGKGARIGTTVTIGYDAPWRQVHAMLLEAAAKTHGVRSDPQPMVLQRALSDFYPEYELVFHIENALDRPQVLTMLHANIQDVFNENGVQIMSPHFMEQPGEAVVVPKSKWFSPPARKDSGE